MSRIILMLVLSLGLSTPAMVQAQAATDGGQASMTALRAALAPGKQVFIARQMALNPEQEAGFWPIYDDHQKGLAELTARRRDNIAALARAAAGSVDEDTAEDLISEALAIEAEQARLIERTMDRMNRVLPPAKALKYLGLELKLSALVRYEAAAALP
jgi:Spy/CpxP family protein refolding chaperone